MVEFPAPRNLLADRSFCYQLGVRRMAANRVLYEAWVEARLPR